MHRETGEKVSVGTAGLATAASVSVYPARQMERDLERSADSWEVRVERRVETPSGRHRLILEYDNREERRWWGRGKMEGFLWAWVKWMVLCS